MKKIYKEGQEMEEWISQRQYMKRLKVGHEVVLKMINNGEVEYRKTPGGQYKIKVGGNTVSKELYEEERKKRIEAETTLNLITKMLVERR